MNKAYGTHQKILKEYALTSSGPIVEFGCGPNSTQMLHDICMNQDRLLISFETHSYWIDEFHDLMCDNHQLYLVDDWSKTVDLVPYEEQLGLVFIDHDPAPRRKIDVELYAHRTDYIVVHDSNNKGYEFEDVFSIFKYIKHYNNLDPSTAVLSNFKQPDLEI